MRERRLSQAWASDSSRRVSMDGGSSDIGRVSKVPCDDWFHGTPLVHLHHPLPARHGAPVFWGVALWASVAPSGLPLSPSASWGPSWASLGVCRSVPPAVRIRL